jgi:pimeloyl-ACP methyl ester carboxylesterase
LIFLLGALVVLTSAISCGIDARQGAAPWNRRQIDFNDCGFASYATKALCGKLEVFEDRRAQAGRKILLSIVMLPALETKPEPDPVFFLTGGPGQGAAKIASAGEDSLMSHLRRRRDLVFVDQRGTGNSHPLNCNLSGDPAILQSYFDELFPVAKISACRVALERHSDLKLYTTPMAVADLDEARSALGYRKINLYALSYGTLMALEYLRRYPGTVRALALAGVTTPAAKLPLPYAKGAQDALDKLLRDCAREKACNAAFPDLKADFAKALAKLAERPATFTLTHPRTGEAQNVTLTRSVFTERLRNMLYNSSTATLLPLVIHRAAQGDWTALARLVTRASSSSHHAPSMGMYFTVTCSESVPSITEDEIARETGATFLGEQRIRTHQQACRQWPRAEIPAAYFAPVRSTVPVLMLSGELDGATPPHLGADAAKSLPNSHQVLLPGTAHGYASNCAKSIAAEFIERGSSSGLTTACLQDLARPPFVRELPPRYLR